MPIYEYRCSKCNEEFELLVRLGTADGDVNCPKCKSTEVKRQLSTFASIGWAECQGGVRGGCKEPTGFG